MDVYAVIMAGGSGTRFWPLSTAKIPKQLLNLDPRSERTLLQKTYDRISTWIPIEKTVIVTTELLAPAVRAQLPGAIVLAEPQGRNTAPCLYWAAKVIAQKNPDAVAAVFPSDHVIPNEPAFLATVKSAAEYASKNSELVTLGVRPARPETGFGYLKLKEVKPSGAQRVERFVEKPNLENAKKFVESGQYLWNGGMFVWQTRVILAAFAALMPEYDRAWNAASGDVAKAYPALTATSVDFGIMEKATNVVSFTLDCGWDDLGSFTAMETLDGIRREEAGVVLRGEVVSVKSSGNIVCAGKNRLVALLGVENLVIAENGDALLIAHKDLAQDVKAILEKVKQARPDLG